MSNKNRKLVVEVVSAHNLMPKDGQGSATAFVKVDFENQKQRTKAKEKSLNPVWNEKLVFTVSDPPNIHNYDVDICVYNEKCTNNHRNFLGKVAIPGTTIVRQGDETLQKYPLEKRSIFSHVRGELGLKVYYFDDKEGGGGKKDDKKKDKDDNNNSNKAQHQKQQQPQQGKGMSQKGDDKNNRVVSFQANHNPADFALKETNPHLGSTDRICSSTYDLVEQMGYVYVRVVKARDLVVKDNEVGCNPYVEVKLGNYKGATRHLEKRNDPDWNQVFAFTKENVLNSGLEIMVKDKLFTKDDLLGRALFDLSEVPTRVPPDSPLAPQWYSMEDKKGDGKVKGEIMLSVWMGTQADESFPDAWHSDSASISVDGLVHIRSKVYLSPKLWYVRVNVIEAQDLAVGNKNRNFFELSVKVQLGGQILKTRPVTNKSTSALWNEDLIFVAAEPFDEHLTLTVEDRIGPNKDEVLRKTMIPLSSLERRFDQKVVNSRWFPLEKGNGKEKEKDIKFSSRIHLRACLDGGYHVLDESTLYSSDLRPAAKQLWRPYIGVLEVGILSAQNLLPMKTKDGRGSTDAYCVAKYGQKWVRTRTIIESFSPKWNEQYTWEVYDPCTVITVGVFDNLQLKGSGGGNNKQDKGGGEAKDMKIGKVRIRLSTLETDRVYTHSYPLLVLHSSGVKKMGELQLAVRFSSSSLFNMMNVYTQPLLPKMHYLHPFSVTQLEFLRHQAMNIVAMRLNRTEPPLRKEVVEYMLDVDSHMWSMRRSKANFFRIIAVFSGLVHAWKWIDDICHWRNPISTVLFHALYLVLVFNPDLILPTAFLYLFMIGVWRYRSRPQYPPHMDATLSHTESVHPDELDEEFDTFPTSKGADLVKLRYDRLRSVAGRIQTVVGDLAAQGERLQALLSWRDPRATSFFIVLCLVIAVILYLLPFRAVASLFGLYVMRHPSFHGNMPSASLCFFRRLPARTDSLL